MLFRSGPHLKKQHGQHNPLLFSCLIPFSLVSLSFFLSLSLSSFLSLSLFLPFSLNLFELLIRETPAAEEQFCNGHRMVKHTTVLLCFPWGSQEQWAATSEEAGGQIQHPSPASLQPMSSPTSRARGCCKDFGSQVAER